MGTSAALLVSPVGIEPTTNWLKANCSTTELRAHAFDVGGHHTERCSACQPRTQTRRPLGLFDRFDDTSPIMTPQQVEKALLPYHWPAEAVSAVAQLVSGVGSRGILPAAQARELVALTGLGQQQTMVALTAVAALYAVPPISNFYVGAVACGA